MGAENGGVGSIRSPCGHRNINSDKRADPLSEELLGRIIDGTETHIYDMRGWG